jgi:ABC-type multidrug transport system permease subunit
MYFFLLSFPILGAGIKYIDDAFDEKRFNTKIALAIAPILGALWAYTMLINPVSATILLAVLCGVFIKGKVDNHAHIAGFLVILATIALAGVEFMILPLLFFAPFALLDEVGNDVIDYNKKYFNTNRLFHKFVRYFFDQRWLLKIAIFIFAILGIIPYYFFIAMLLFDGAYLIMRWFSQSKKQRPDYVSFSKEPCKAI